MSADNPASSRRATRFWRGEAAELAAPNDLWADPHAAKAASGISQYFQ
jgi:hypothetical protein